MQRLAAPAAVQRLCRCDRRRLPTGRGALASRFLEFKLIKKKKKKSPFDPVSPFCFLNSEGSFASDVERLMRIFHYPVQWKSVKKHTQQISKRLSTCLKCRAPSCCFTF